MRKLAPLLLALALLTPAAAQAAPPNPFGHTCLPRDGVLFCPTATDAQRVASWDGVPLDVDVTLPATGDGPFPTIVMMHGWGQHKGSFGGAAATYARLGYAVVTPSARGFGRSCGAPDSRTAPGCDRGWVRLADHRYEGRDVQHLLGLLVDQGVAAPRALGVTGVSYGGIQSLNLARLRDRIRLPNGSYRRWRSPRGTRLRIAAAYPRWGASDLTSSLQPNGRFLDFGRAFLGQSIEPGGVQKQSYVFGLFISGEGAGFYAPADAPFNANIRRWKELTDRGEPQTREILAVGRELSRYHSMVGVSGTPAPLLVQNGWTDDLFPAPEALRVWRLFRRTKGARVSLQLADLGHPRGGNNPAVNSALEAQGVRFFAAYLKRSGRAPRHGAVTAYTQTCPATEPSGGPFRARSWERLHPGRVRLAAPAPQRIASDGGDPDISSAVNPIGGRPACEPLPAARAAGTAIAQRTVRRPFTLLGMPTVRARIRTRGRGGFVAARLWDVSAGRQLLVARGVYRLEDHQRGRIVFQLFGNGWRFERGHTVKLELLGRDSAFLRTSNFDFSVRVSDLTASLPTRER